MFYGNSATGRIPGEECSTCEELFAPPVFNSRFRLQATQKRPVLVFSPASFRRIVRGAALLPITGVRGFAPFGAKNKYFSCGE
jgi:hypothetical protein